MLAFDLSVVKPNFVKRLPAGLAEDRRAEGREMVTLGINEQYAEEDVRDIAGAIRKVAENLRPE